MQASPEEKGVKPSAKPLDTLNLLYVWVICLVAALGGLLFGYDWVVIGGAKPFFERYFQVNTGALSGWANSCALVGCLIGSSFTGALSDWLGRKRLLAVAALLFAVSSVLTGWAPSFGAFVMWRIMGGVAIGMASNLSPLYIAEVAPTQLRGRLVAINQLTIVIGILAAQVVNWLIAVHLPHATQPGKTLDEVRFAWNIERGWRWMFTAVAVPSMGFFAGALMVPESPRWLVKNGLVDRARAILSKVGGHAYAEAEIAEIQTTLAKQDIGRVPLRALLEQKVMRILFVGVSLAVLQQWSGINSIFNYAEEIYRSAGYGISDIMFNIVITGAINLAFTLVAIGTVDKVGRRVLMLIGCAGIGLAHVLIGTAYAVGLKGPVVLALTLAALGCYAMSLAPVTWVLIAEIFPNRIRGTAISVAVSALWIACFLLTFMFPILRQEIGMAGTFWLYSAICFAGFVFVYRRVPETKGKSLETIEHELLR